MKTITDLTDYIGALPVITQADSKVGVELYSILLDCYLDDNPEGSAYDTINTIIEDCIEDLEDSKTKKQERQFTFMPHELVEFLEEHKIPYDPEYNL